MSAVGPSNSNRPAKPEMPAKPDMIVSEEMQAWLKRLKSQDRKIDMRNKLLAGALTAAAVLLLLTVWGVYRSTIGAYAVIDNIEITQHPIDQGRLQIKFRVLSPGKVYCRRTAGNAETELVDFFSKPCEVERPWGWTYQPGEKIKLTLQYRSGLFKQELVREFSTADQADIVILMDTTGSMSPSIRQLQQKCVTFSEELKKMNLRPRLALIGFGDVGEGRWLDRHGFTADAEKFRQNVDDLRRFDGGDFPESALDALETALALPMDGNAIRRFYLVTDATYHEPTRTKATAERIAAKLEERNILLHVFSKPEFKEDYEKLLGETGRFWEIENFGGVLSEGRVLED
jgi:hypothetical protein